MLVSRICGCKRLQGLSQFLKIAEKELDLGNISPNWSNTYITKTTTITVHATADDWQLFDLAGREDAAVALNHDW